MGVFKDRLIVTKKRNEETEELLSRDGQNLSNKKIKRGYLSTEEFNSYMILAASAQISKGERNINSKESRPMCDIWEERGIITKEQKRNLKMATTYLSKFVDSVLQDNLDAKSKKTLANKISSWNFRLVDDVTVRRLTNMHSMDNDVSMSTENFFSLVEDKMEANCKGCTKNRCDCDIHTFFEEYLIPPASTKTEDKCNCEYSY